MPPPQAKKPRTDVGEQPPLLSLLPQPGLNFVMGAAAIAAESARISGSFRCVRGKRVGA